MTVIWRMWFGVLCGVSASSLLLGRAAETRGDDARLQLSLRRDAENENTIRSWAPPIRRLAGPAPDAQHGSRAFIFASASGTPSCGASAAGA
jgi:hypothetical protein